MEGAGARMLVNLRLDNWKSFGTDAEARNLVLFSPLTLLVGPNASGKSNVLDAIRFLQGMARDLTIEEILRGRWEGGQEVWPAIRGGIAEAAARGGETGFAFTSAWTRIGSHSQMLVLTPGLHVQPDMHHHLRVSTGANPGIEAEQLTLADGTVLMDTHANVLRGRKGRQDGGGISVALKGHGKGNSPTLVCSSARSLLGQLQEGERVEPEVLQAAQDIREQLREALFLDIHPSRMRDYVPDRKAPLTASGQNISAVLSAMDGLDDAVDWLSELCVPKIERIEFERTRLQDVMFMLVEGGGQTISARSLSDGTLRFLGLVVALLTCPRGTLVLLEEPDIGLHPSRIHLLAQLLEQVTDERGIQVVATTHSPTLLAHLSESSLGAVVAFQRDVESGATVCSALKDLPHFDILKNAPQLEHLISTGWLERAL